MAKKVRFPLILKDDAEVRSVAELREHFDIEKIVAYHTNGKLKTWLEDRYEQDLAERVGSIATDDTSLAAKLCEVFGVEFEGEVDAEAAAERSRRIARLRQMTDDEEILRDVDLVAFDQDDLYDRYDEGRETIILCEAEFEIPEAKKDLTYKMICGAKIRGEEEAKARAEAKIKAESEAKKKAKANAPSSPFAAIAEALEMVTKAQTQQSLLFPSGLFGGGNAASEDLSGKANIDQDRCVGCGACEGACPVSAIKMDGGHARVDAASCVECGACVSTCPVSAIS